MDDEDAPQLLYFLANDDDAVGDGDTFPAGSVVTLGKRHKAGASAAHS
jgi:hypothetical protein